MKAMPAKLKMRQENKVFYMLIFTFIRTWCGLEGGKTIGTLKRLGWGFKVSCSIFFGSGHLMRWIGDYKYINIMDIDKTAYSYFQKMYRFI